MHKILYGTLTFICCLILTVNGYSQETDISFKNENHVVNDPEYSKLVNKLEFGAIHQVGKPSFMLKLDELLSISTGFNVSFSYDNSGFIPGEEDGLLGHSWSISGINEVSRVVNGFADEFQRGNYNRGFTNNDMINLYHNMPLIFTGDNYTVDDNEFSKRGDVVFLASPNNLSAGDIANMADTDNQDWTNPFNDLKFNYSNGPDSLVLNNFNTIKDLEYYDFERDLFSINGKKAIRVGNEYVFQGDVTFTVRDKVGSVNGSGNGPFSAYNSVINEFTIEDNSSINKYGDYGLLIKSLDKVDQLNNGITFKWYLTEKKSKIDNSVIKYSYTSDNRLVFQTSLSDRFVTYDPYTFSRQVSHSSAISRIKDTQSLASVSFNATSTVGKKVDEIESNVTGIKVKFNYVTITRDDSVMYNFDQYDEYSNLISRSGVNHHTVNHKIDRNYLTNIEIYKDDVLINSVSFTYEHGKIRSFLKKIVSKNNEGILIKSYEFGYSDYMYMNVLNDIVYNDYRTDFFGYYNNDNSGVYYGDSNESLYGKKAEPDTLCNRIGVLKTVNDNQGLGINIEYNNHKVYGERVSPTKIEKKTLSYPIDNNNTSFVYESDVNSNRNIVINFDIDNYSVLASPELSSTRNVGFHRSIYNHTPSELYDDLESVINNSLLIVKDRVMSYSDVESIPDMTLDINTPNNYGIIKIKVERRAYGKIGVKVYYNLFKSIENGEVISLNDSMFSDFGYLGIDNFNIMVSYNIITPGNKFHSVYSIGGLRLSKVQTFSYGDLINEITYNYGNGTLITVPRYTIKTQDFEGTCFSLIKYYDIQNIQNIGVLISKSTPISSGLQYMGSNVYYDKVTESVLNQKTVYNYSIFNENSNINDGYFILKEDDYNLNSIEVLVDNVVKKRIQNEYEFFNVKNKIDMGFKKNDIVSLPIDYYSDKTNNFHFVNMGVFSLNKYYLNDYSNVKKSSTEYYYDEVDGTNRLVKKIKTENRDFDEYTLSPRSVSSSVYSPSEDLLGSYETRTRFISDDLNASDYVVDATGQHLVGLSNDQVKQNLWYGVPVERELVWQGADSQPEVLKQTRATYMSYPSTDSQKPVLLPYTGEQSASGVALKSWKNYYCDANDVANKGKIKHQINANSDTVSYQWYGDGLLKQQQSPSGLSTMYFWNIKRQLEKQQAPNGMSQRYVYDAAGRLSKLYRESGSFSGEQQLGAYAYIFGHESGSNYNRIQSTSYLDDKGSYAVSNSYVNAVGEPLLSEQYDGQDPSHVIKSYSFYDQSRKVVGQSVPLLSDHVGYGDSSGPASDHLSADMQLPDEVAEEMAIYLSQVDLAATEAPHAFVYSGHDGFPLFRPTLQTQPGDSVLQALNEPEKSLSTTTAYGLSVTGEYVDGLGQGLPGALQKVTSTDANGHQSISYSDNWGRQRYSVQLMDADGSAAKALVTRYDYDDLGQLTRVVNPKGDSHYYRYNNHGWLLRKRLAEWEGWEHYGYDKLGRVRMLVRADQGGAADQSLDEQQSVKAYFTDYDNEGRESVKGYVPAWQMPENQLVDATSQNLADIEQSVWLSKSYYDGQLSQVDGIDLYTHFGISQAQVEQQQNYAKGQLSGRVWREEASQDKKGYELFLYNGEGLVSRYIQQLPGLTDYFSVSYAYDLGGRMIEQEFKRISGGVATDVFIHEYSYDALGRMEQVRSGQSQEQLVTDAEYTKYAADGSILALKLGNGAQQVDYRYSLQGWLRAINDVDALGTDLFAQRLEYNSYREAGLGYTDTMLGGTGNITQQSWRHAGQDQTLMEYSYSYDRASRLKAADLRNNGVIQLKNSVDQILYDKAGNIESKRYYVDNSNAAMLVEDDFTYALGTSRLAELTRNDQTDPFEFSYDAYGNMTAHGLRGISSLSYDSRNLVTQMQGSQGEQHYNYDVYGNRYKYDFESAKRWYVRGADGTVYAVYEQLKLKDPNGGYQPLKLLYWNVLSGTRPIGRKEFSDISNNPQSN